MARSAIGALALGLLVVPVAAGDPLAAPHPFALDTGTTLEVSSVAPGVVFTAPPEEVALPRASPPTLREIQAHMRAGDTDRALADARAYAERAPGGRQRDAVWFLVGMLEREQGRPNAASEAFTAAKASDGPLAPYAAWYEAEQDFARGKPWVAIKECETYRERWPEGPHGDDCLRLMARALASQGKGASALAAADSYDLTHDDAPIRETVELELAEWETRNDPASAVKRLRRLSVEHTQPLTGRYAEELLGMLAAQGVEGAAVPDDTESLKRRAISLRDSGRLDAAWDAWTELTTRADDDTALGQWLTAQAPVFGWRTRRFDFLSEIRRAEYEASPNGDTAWELYRTLERAAQYEAAADVALTAQQKHGTGAKWKYSQQEVGRTLMLAGRYPEATAQFDVVAARGGWVGRAAAYDAAFSAFSGGDAEGAVTRFDAILGADKSHVSEARYWRAQALEAVGRVDDAAADRAWLQVNEPQSWYALLARQGSGPADGPYARDGSWPGPALPDAALPGAARAPEGVPLPVARPSTTDAWDPNEGFAALAWPMRVAPVQHVTPPPPSIVLQDPWSPPSSYRSGRFFDDRAAATALSAFVEGHGIDFPVLPVVEDLASIGLYDLAGPMFAAFYEDWTEALRSRGDPSHLAARAITLRQEEWRPLFLYVRDHHHSARFTFGLHQSVESPQDRAQAMALSWPLAHDRYVWSHARQHDIDPYLVLGLMRQESTYDPFATSRVGARGAMQIMPRTGHLLADLAHDTDFTAGDLNDPVEAVGFGLVYLGLLMDRFDGVYPLAVASYNGGPHNVSAWLKGTGRDMPVDQFVEHIPFRETRNYVKQVSSFYATYASLYAPPGTAVVVPKNLLGDDPSVVDF